MAFVGHNELSRQTLPMGTARFVLIRSISASFIVSVIQSLSAE